MTEDACSPWCATPASQHRVRAAWDGLCTAEQLTQKGTPRPSRRRHQSVPVAARCPRVVQHPCARACADRVCVGCAAVHCPSGAPPRICVACSLTCCCVGGAPPLPAAFFTSSAVSSTSTASAGRSSNTCAGRGCRRSSVEIGHSAAQTPPAQPATRGGLCPVCRCGAHPPTAATRRKLRPQPGRSQHLERTWATTRVRCSYREPPSVEGTLCTKARASATSAMLDAISMIQEFNHTAVG